MVLAGSDESYYDCAQRNIWRYSSSSAVVYVLLRQPHQMPLVLACDLECPAACELTASATAHLSLRVLPMASPTKAGARTAAQVPARAGRLPSPPCGCETIDSRPPALRKVVLLPLRLLSQNLVIRRAS